MNETPLRIAVLYDEWHEEQEPEPEEPAESPPSGKRKKKRERLDREEVFEALKKRGHIPKYHCLDGRPRSLKSLAGVDVDLVFNLTESYGGDDTQDIAVAAYLDLLGLPYTGSGPAGLHLAQDKAVAKRLFSFHGIRTPNFAAIYRGRLDWSHDIHFPVIVKPKREDGSIGIEFNAVVESIKELMERIDQLHADLDSPVLVEEYIEGRELYVGVLGNDPPQALPIVELNLADLPEGTPRIAGTEVKWERGTAAYKKTKLRMPDDLSETTVEEIQQTAIQACRTLEVRDYARVDLRLKPDGTWYTLEVNPNPWLHSSAEFVLAAKQAGRDHVGLIEEIALMARARGGRKRART